MRKYLAVVLLASLSFNASAALVDNGAYTSDDISGLDWLDLTTTFNMSMDAAVAANSGWRFATRAEAEGLFGQLFPSATNAFQNYNYSDLTEVNDYLNMFGYSPTQNNKSWGLFIESDGFAGLMGVFENGPTTIVYGPDYSTSTWATDVAYENYATFLVRGSAVPVPAAVWLFGSALGGLGWMRRRKTN